MDQGGEAGHLCVSEHLISADAHETAPGWKVDGVHFGFSFVCLFGLVSDRLHFSLSVELCATKVCFLTIYGGIEVVGFLAARPDRVS